MCDDVAQLGVCNGGRELASRRGGGTCPAAAAVLLASGETSAVTLGESRPVGRSAMRPWCGTVTPARDCIGTGRSALTGVCEAGGAPLSGVVGVMERACGGRGRGASRGERKGEYAGEGPGERRTRELRRGLACGGSRGRGEVARSMGVAAGDIASAVGDVGRAVGEVARVKGAAADRKAGEWFPIRTREGRRRAMRGFVRGASGCSGAEMGVMAVVIGDMGDSAPDRF